MKDTNYIFEQLKSRLGGYKEEPNEKIWQNIEKQINKPKFTTLKTITIIGGVLVIGVIGALVIAPAKTDSTKMITVQENTIQKSENIAENQQFADINSSVVTSQTVNTTEPTVNKIANNENDSTETRNIISNTDNNLLIIAKNDKTPSLSVTTSQQENTANENKQQNEVKKLQTAQNTTKTSGENPADTITSKDYLPMPNAFEPMSNDDRVKVFKPAYKEVKSFEMQIFARNGMKVFMTKDITRGWDGTIKGKMADRGTYIYYITYEDTEGKTHEQKGSLWLHR